MILHVSGVKVKISKHSDGEIVFRLHADGRAPLSQTGLDWPKGLRRDGNREKHV
jgi:hypothetical protein